MVIHMVACNRKNAQKFAKHFSVSMSPTNGKVFEDVPLEKPDEIKKDDMPQKHQRETCSCRRFAKKTQSRIHKTFYKLGCFIQRHYITVFVFGLLLHSVLLFGLKDMSIEHNIEKMWVASGGRLEKELANTKLKLGKNGYGSELQVLIQVKKANHGNLLNSEALLEHLEMLKKVMKLKVNMYYNNWSLSDFCFKFEMPFTVHKELYKSIKQLTPCVIMTPLDCFWEGSFIANKNNHQHFDWSQHSPMELLSMIKEYQPTAFNSSVKFLKKVGLKHGYLNKTCLNNKDKQCPQNKKKKARADIGDVLSRGCTGISQNYMRWPKDLIISGEMKNSRYNRVDAYQSVIQLLDAQNFYRTALTDSNINDELKLRVNSIEGGFTPAVAKNILAAWKIAFTDLVNNQSKQSGKSSKFLAFSSSSFEQLVHQLTSIDHVNIIIAFAMLVTYAVLLFKRWTRAVSSYATVGVASVVCAGLSVASGLGFSSFVGMKLTAASTKVLPFLALALGTDCLFLLARTYMVVCDAGIPDKRIVGTCLAECGLSITVTMAATAFGLLATAVMPIITLREFAFQGALIIFVFFISSIFVLPSLLSLDVERLKMKRFDLCCCYTEIEDEEDIAYDVRSIPQPFVIGDQRKRRQFNVDKHNTICPKPSHESVSLLKTLTHKFSMTYFAQRYFGKWIVNTQLKVIVLFLCCVQLFLAGYGTAKVKQGLDISEMVPRGTAQYEYLQARQNYFSYFEINVAASDTNSNKIFDFANNQLLLYQFHDRLSNTAYVVKDKTVGHAFWLPIYRDWLKEVEVTFADEWTHGLIHHGCVPKCRNASKKARLAYRLLSTELGLDWNYTRNSLVLSNDLINPKYFYIGLTLWYWYDALGVHKSQIGLRPEPNKPTIKFTKKFDSSYVADPQFLTMPFQVNNLQKTEDFVRLIKSFRSICKVFESRGLRSYPMGDPFTHWEQFVFIHTHILVALIATLVTLTTVLSIAIMNARATCIVIFFVGLLLFEVYGFIGLLGLQLNSILVVVLIMSVGVGVSNSVHTVMAFLNTLGDRNERVTGALEVTLASLCDNCISSLLMLVLLSFSPFDFIVRYFFHLMVCIQVTATFNALFVLPTILSFIGPCPEVENRCIRPTLTPCYQIPISIQITSTHRKPSRKPSPAFRRKTLTPIQEMSERCSSAGSFTTSRPMTPFTPSFSRRLESPDVEISANELFGRSRNSISHHAPKMLDDVVHPPGKNDGRTRTRHGENSFRNSFRDKTTQQKPPRRIQVTSRNDGNLRSTTLKTTISLDIEMSNFYDDSLPTVA